MLVKFTVESWWRSTSWSERLKKWIVGPLGTHPVLAVDKMFCLEASRFFFSLLQAWHSPVVPPQTWSVVHFSFSGPRHPMSIFLWSLCVCVCCAYVCVHTASSPLREPLHLSFCLMENLMPQRVQTAAVHPVVHWPPHGSGSHHCASALIAVT